jgi:hypothetical protein
MAVEGAVAITAALAAGSVVLLGFGLDSVIEALASVIVIWRFTGDRRLSDLAEELGGATRCGQLLSPCPVCRAGRDPDADCR